MIEEPLDAGVGFAHTWNPLPNHDPTTEPIGHVTSIESYSDWGGAWLEATIQLTPEGWSRLVGPPWWRRMLSLKAWSRVLVWLIIDKITRPLGGA